MEVRNYCVILDRNMLIEKKQLLQYFAWIYCYNLEEVDLLLLIENGGEPCQG